MAISLGVYPIFRQTQMPTLVLCLEYMMVHVLDDSIWHRTYCGILQTRLKAILGRLSCILFANHYLC